MDRGAWWATVHGVAKSRTRLSDFTFIFQSKGAGLIPGWELRFHMPHGQKIRTQTTETNTTL